MTNLNVLPFAKEARKTVGAYLLQELGFLRKGKTGKFFRAEKEIFLFAFLEKPTIFTHASSGITPMYIPNATNTIFGQRLQGVFPGYIDLSETDDEQKSRLWTEKTIHILNNYMIPFYKQLVEPSVLLNYIENRTFEDRRWVSIWPEMELKAYTLAYLGKRRKAIEELEVFKNQKVIENERIVDRVINELKSIPEGEDNNFFEGVIAENKKRLGLKE